MAEDIEAEETRYSVRVTVVCDNYFLAELVMAAMEEAAGKFDADLIESNIE